MVTCRGSNDGISGSTVEDHLASDEPKINLPSYSLRTHEQLISKGFVASIMVS